MCSTFEAQLVAHFFPNKPNLYMHTYTYLHLFTDTRVWVFEISTTGSMWLPCCISQAEISGPRVMTSEENSHSSESGCTYRVYTAEWSTGTEHSWWDKSCCFATTWFLSYQLCRGTSSRFTFHFFATKSETVIWQRIKLSSSVPTPVFALKMLHRDLLGENSCDCQSFCKNLT